MSVGSQATLMCRHCNLTWFAFLKESKREDRGVGWEPGRDEEEQMDSRPRWEARLAQKMEERTERFRGFGKSHNFFLPVLDPCIGEGKSRGEKEPEERDRRESVGLASQEPWAGP